MKTDHLLHNWSLLEWRSFKGDGSRGRAALHLRVRNEGVADNITEKVMSRSSPGGGACRGEKERKCDIPDKSQKPESRSMSRAPGRFCWRNGGGVKGKREDGGVSKVTSGRTLRVSPGGMTWMFESRRTLCNTPRKV